MLRMKTSYTKLRPDELTPYSWLARVLDFFRAMVGGDRFSNLYNAINSTIHNLYPDKIPAKLIDYGCGMMAIPMKLKSDGAISGFIGLDIYPADGLLDTSDGRVSYLQIGPNWTQELSDYYEVAIVTDVLHHVDSDKERVSILRDLSCLAEFIIVKDHFEYGIFSRQLLRFIDWLGNFAYGVRIPDEYFTKESWLRLITEAGLTQIKLQDEVKIHSGLVGFFIPSRYHFISVLKKLN